MVRIPQTTAGTPGSGRRLGALEKVKKETDMIEICVEGFTMTYTPQSRKLTVDDFKDIELGDSMQDI